MRRFNARAFALRTPGPRPAAGAESDVDSQPTRRFYYERLMQVSIRHDFYNAARHECPDFRIAPTTSTAELMYSLGLLFRYEGTGFSVLLDDKRRGILFNYLRRSQQTGSPAFGYWSRLSFVLTNKNSYFVNFTDIPVDVHPPERNYYFTNMEAHTTPGGPVLLTPDARVDGADLLRVVGAQVTLRLSPSVVRVLVRDISGKVVIEEPGEGKPRPWAESPFLAFIDFSQLPEDVYTIELVDVENVRKADVLYTVEAPVPLCFIDLLFTNPTGGEPGVYPVTGLDTNDPIVEPVHYELRFGARSTYWNYFVVPQSRHENFEGLRIESLSQSPPVEFAGPCRVRLANGSHAYLFSSFEPLELQQQSTYHFRLLGRHGLMTHEGVLVERMPVATMKQVIPMNEEESCERLVTSLLPGAEDEKPCRRLADLFCLNEGAGGRGPGTRIYSDTYVYV